MIKLANSFTEFELSPTLAANEMVGQHRARGEQVLHLGFGQSPFPVPERLKKALGAAAHRKEYVPTFGLQDLCDPVKEYYERHTGLNPDAFDVLMAPGSKLILYALQMAIEGDLLMPIPSWVSYAPQSKMLHNEVINVPTTLDDQGFHIDAEELRAVIHQARKAGKNPRKLILNYPSNPTGLIIPDDELKKIGAVCVEEDILIISDEIYGFVSFDNQYHSIAQHAPTHTAVTSGLSKHLSLGGWRIGVGFIPKAVDGLYASLCQIASETWSCVPAPIQQAVIEAYRSHDDVEQHIKDCTAIHALMNRYIATGLQKLGVHAPTPQGAFYNYPNFGAFREQLATINIKTSQQLADYLLSTHGLVTLPGVAFGAPPEDLTLRLAGCDYDGEAVLAAYQSGESLDDAFIAKHAPNIKKAVEEFGAFLKPFSAS